MIIKGEAPRNSKRTFKILSIAILVAVVIAGLYSILNKSANAAVTDDDVTIFCGAEKKADGLTFVHGGHQFDNGQTQSSEEAYEGKYASKIGPENAYGISYNYDNFQPLDEVEVTIWIKANNPKSVYLVAMSAKDKKYYHQTNENHIVENGWIKRKLNLVMPEEVEGPIKFYAYTSNKTDNAYLDNFKLINKSAATRAGLFTPVESEEGSMNFSVKALNKLSEKRNKALALGLLVKGEDDWVKAKFKTKNLEETEVKVRLKGDWTDHLEGDFWSYRVKMPSGTAWNRVTTFSLSNPQTRSNLMEWVFHKMMEREDVLTPRYDFIKLKVNNKTQRTYAFEEHFEKQIVECKSRREGVVIRYDETENWDARKRDKINDSGYFNKLPNKENQAIITPFAEKKVVTTPKLLEQFNEASSLLRGFQHYELTASEVFDVDLLAKYYAISEIMKAYHSTIWHNTRFYYNPIIKKLEPIGFDGFTPNGAFDFHGNVFFGAYRSSSLKSYKQDAALYLFRDPNFNKAYTQYLYKFSRNDYIEKFFAEIDNELTSKEKLIKVNKPDYHYKSKDVYNQAKTIQSALQVTNEVTVNAYTNNCNAGNCEIELTNNHVLPLEYIGTSESKKILPEAREATLLYANRRYGNKEYKSVTVPKSHKYVHYKLSGVDGIYYSTIKPWSSPQVKTDMSTDKSLLQLPGNAAGISVSDNTVTISGGSHRLKKALLIPKGYNLIIEPGAVLDFTNKAYLLCYGPVQMIGSLDQPISVTSSDKTSQGFHILQAKSKSIVKNCQFTNLNTLLEGSWQMTGAVTFYESPVNLDKVTIGFNLCEDALNIIRTDFTANELHVNNTFADGFDSDFCSGTLTNALFNETGNDGIDFSGSIVNIENIVLNNIGDKGISAGEQATLNVKNATINNAVIGVASKDLSKVTLENVTLEKCNKGFAAYQKKPEFGPGSIYVKSYKATEVDFLQIAENNSIIELPTDQK